MTKPPGFRGSDIIAGISVALLLIPQSMALAGIAGLPPVHGLYAAILPPIFAAFFVSSPYLQTGPVAMTAILCFGALSTLATPMTPEYIGLAALLALVVGVIRVVVGGLRAGFVAYLMSQPVLIGFVLRGRAPHHREPVTYGVRDGRHFGFLPSKRLRDAPPTG